MPRKKNKKSRFVAIIIVVVVALWILSGVFVERNNNPEYVDTSGAKYTNVQIRELSAIEHQRYIKLYGVTEASRRVELKAATEGKVENILAKEGLPIKKGDIILRIEIRDRQAKVTEAEALVKQREVDYEAGEKLSTKGFTAQVKLAENLANLEAARATLIRAKLDVERTIIRAPFDGILNKIHVEEGDLISSFSSGSGQQSGLNNSVATIISYEPYLLVAQVSERVVKHLKLGQHGEAELVTGQKAKGIVSYIASVADTKTRTFRIELTVHKDNNNIDSSIKSGVTASIKIPVEKRQAHNIPPSSLSLNAKGELGIKLLKTDGFIGEKRVGTVVFHPIEIYEDAINGIWVSGLPRNIILITTGQAFVKIGESAMGELEKIPHTNNKNTRPKE